MKKRNSLIALITVLIVLMSLLASCGKKSVNAGGSDDSDLTSSTSTEQTGSDPDTESGEESDPESGDEVEPGTESGGPGSGSSTKPPSSSTKPPVSSSTTPISPPPVGEKPEIVKAQYYGYTRLTPAEKAIYDSIYNALENYRTEAPIPLSSGETIMKVLKYLRSDCPQFFWMPNDIWFSGPEEGKDAWDEIGWTNLYGTKDQILAKKAAVDAQLNAIISDLKTKSDYEKIKTVHDRLVGHISYTQPIPAKGAAGYEDVYNIYGALVNKSSVCEGYAESFQLAMYKLGINCASGIGKATNSSGIPEEHKWNYVQCDNVWYGMDVTWDDPIGGSLSYKYFMVTTAEFNKTRPVQDPGNYPHPNCTKTNPYN